MDHKDVGAELHARIAIIAVLPSQTCSASKPSVYLDHLLGPAASLGNVQIWLSRRCSFMF